MVNPMSWVIAEQMFRLMCLITISIQLCTRLSFLSCGQPDDDDDEHVWLKHVLILTQSWQLTLAVFLLGKDNSLLPVTCNQCMLVKKYVGLKCSGVFCVT
jgi:hypothetical protein